MHACLFGDIISSMASPPPDESAGNPVPPLDYATPNRGGMVLLARFGTSDEAELHAAELEAEGIPTQILNSHVNALGIPYSGLSDVELHVRAGDVGRADELLKHAGGEDLEPAPEGGLAEPAVDESENPIPIAPLASFESVRLLREAQTLLASARLHAYMPKLVPRGDRPPGVGKRFLLAVAEDDLERAQLLLRQAESDAAEELPRCPKCASWRVFPVSHLLQSLAATFGLAPKPAEELECLACRHRGPSAEFARGR
jgi:hypothetical protein